MSGLLVGKQGSRWEMSGFVAAGSIILRWEMGGFVVADRTILRLAWLVSQYLVPLISDEQQARFVSDGVILR